MVFGTDASGGNSSGFWLICAAVCLLLLRPATLLGQEDPQAQPPDRVRTEILYRDGKVVLLSETQERLTRSRYRASGRVELSFQDIVITCDLAEYDEETREGFAEGTVRFSQGNQWLVSSRAEFNFADQTAAFHDATGFTDQEFMVQGELLRKTGPDTYALTKGTITACNEKNPKWAFGMGAATVNVDRTARLKSVVFKIKGIPVLYTPYLVIPMEQKRRSSGLLPFHSGDSTSKGRMFSQGYFQTLGESADLTLYGDYFTLRGLAMGGIFRARPNTQSRLYLQAYGIQDRLNQGGAQLAVDGETRLPQGFRAVASVNITTNFRFRQAFSDSFRSATIPEERSVLFLTRNEGSYSTNIYFQRDEALFPGRSLVIRKSPAIDFSSLGAPLGNSPFIFSFTAAAEGLSRTDSQIETPRMMQRLDFHPRLAFRLPSIAGFSLFPSAGFRTTYYSARLSPDENPVVLSSSLRREYFDFEVDVRPPTLEKDYQSKILGKFRHVVEPYAVFRRIDGISNLRETIRFDAGDAIAETTEIEYGIFNRIFRTRETSSGSHRRFEFLSLGIMQKYFFDPDFGGAFRNGELNSFYPLNTLTGLSRTGIQRMLAPASAVLRLSPAETISYDIRADYDPKLRRLRDTSVSAHWYQDGIAISGTYFKSHALEPGTLESHHVQGQAGFGSVNRGLSGSVTFSYNIRTSNLLNSHSRLNYAWDCCGVSLQFQQFDLGLRTESRLSFSFSLKGIGSFGTIKRPESLF